MLILGAQNAFKNQHKFNQKMDSFFDHHKNSFLLKKNRARGLGTWARGPSPPATPSIINHVTTTLAALFPLPGLARNGKSVEAFANRN